VLSAGSLVPELVSAAAGAQDGTLHLAALDEMDATLQSRLAEILNGGFGRLWRLGGLSGEPDLRLVASARATGVLDRQPALHPALRDELAFLSFAIEPLAARPEDVEALALYFYRSYRGTEVALPAEAARALRWAPPKSISELRRRSAYLAAFGGSGGAGAEELFFPPAGETGRKPAATAEAALVELARSCAEGQIDFPRADRLHTVLYRALAHLSRRFREPLTLAEIARAALASPSHLSHLFKQQLGLSPIAFLTRVRVERAKQLLRAERSLNVSQVAERAGFADLSLLERAFKRLVGTTPKRFRRGEAPLRTAKLARR